MGNPKDKGRFGAMFAFGMGCRGRRIVSFSRHGTQESKGLSPKGSQGQICGIICGMKVLTITCALMCASAFGGVMPQLPPPTFADTEVWTNVPCAQLLSWDIIRGT